MSNLASRPIKAIVLAAGPGKQDGAPFFKVLAPLGQRKVIDYVIDLVTRFVPANDIYVVVGYQREQVESHLGDAYQYVVQDQLLGTGHAVLQVCSHLESYQDDLLILYGDTPLFRPNSISGMLNRHHLKEADLTLFTALTPQPLPYGRVIREMGGQIMGIIEETDASEEVLAIRELNAGAYIARSEPLFNSLEQLERGRKGKSLQLTEIVHQLIRSGSRVTSYTSCDPDEMIGINTPDDLEQAEFILNKRYLRPARVEENSEIRFGTGGWRAIIGEGFTMLNVRRLSQALANRLTRQNLEKQGVLIGYDRRFLADRAAEVAAEVFAGNNIPVILLPEAAPTPLITFATVEQEAALGLAFTASHNPPEWNGLKVFREDGSLLLTKETNQIESESNNLTTDDIVKIELDLALEDGIVHYKDFTNVYVDAVESLVDMSTIREAGLKVVVDPGNGAASKFASDIFVQMGYDVLPVNDEPDGLFPGRSPEPNDDTLQGTIDFLRRHDADLAVCFDGDADRVVFCDKEGFLGFNEPVAFVSRLAVKKTGKKKVATTVETGTLLDLAVKDLGVEVVRGRVGDVPVAHLAKQLDAALGVEQVGVYIMPEVGYYPDSIFASLFLLSQLSDAGEIRKFFQGIPRLFFEKTKVSCPNELKEPVMAHVKERAGVLSPNEINTLDGLRLQFADSWMLIRPSGTEPVVRVIAESMSQKHTTELISKGEEIVRGLVEDNR